MPLCDRVVRQTSNGMALKPAEPLEIAGPMRSPSGKGEGHRESSSSSSSSSSRMSVVAARALEISSVEMYGCMSRDGGGIGRGDSLLEFSTPKPPPFSPFEGNLKLLSPPPMKVRVRVTWSGLALEC